MNQRALKTYVFYCSNNLAADQFAGLCHDLEGDTIKTISLPCSGKVDVPYLIKAFETGADGVAIVTCPKNECRHFEGNLRAHKRAEEKGVGPVIGEIKQFIERVRNLPPACACSGAANKQESTVA
jgi:coenzyme F420-reducing hydrogenase delta subunit